MLHALVFVLAREGVLPEAPASWQSLVEAQRQGLRSGTQLRLFRVPEGWDGNLAALVADGAAKASGETPFPADSSASLVCDEIGRAHV